MELKIKITKDDDGFMAEVENLPGCYTQGETLKDVLINLEEAIKLYTESRKKSSHEDRI